MHADVLFFSLSPLHIAELVRSAQRARQVHARARSRNTIWLNVRFTDRHWRQRHSWLNWCNAGRCLFLNRHRTASTGCVHATIRRSQWRDLPTARNATQK